MPDTFQCPACGGLIEYSVNSLDMACPFCGTDVTTPGAGAAATVVMPKIEREPENAAAAQTMVQQSRFNSAAEILDEVKRLLREDDKAGAVKVYRKEFGVPLAEAKTAVDQIEIDMQHSGKDEIPPPPPQDAPKPAWTAPNEPYTSEPSYTSEPAIQGDVVFDSPKSSQSKGWLIGCGIALIVFCCLCVVLPSVISIVKTMLAGITTSP